MLLTNLSFSVFIFFLSDVTLWKQLNAVNVSPSLILTMEMEYIVKSRYHRLHFTASQKIQRG